MIVAVGFMSGSLTLDAVLLLAVILGIPLFSAFVLGASAVQKRTKTDTLRARLAWVEKPWLRRSSLAALGIYAAAFLYGRLIEAQWIEVTTTQIRVSPAVLGRERVRIVHLSDLHLSRIGRLERRMIELVNEAQPDLIVITGDFCGNPDSSEAVHDVLRQLHARYGTFGVTGNNDWKQVITRESLEECGVRLLQDETAAIEMNGRRLRLAGQNVRSKAPLRDILGAGGSDVYTVYLHHFPDVADELSRLAPGQRVDLFLCGHTHGGQVCLPFWGAVVTESKFHKRFERGLYQVHGIPMYVNRGIGVTGVPIRILARPEVAMIELVPE
jgi:predicted MPP superfamily phosphohydrolase